MEHKTENMSTRFSVKICRTSLRFRTAAEHEVYLLHFGESKYIQYHLRLKINIKAC